MTPRSLLVRLLDHAGDPGVPVAREYGYVDALPAAHMRRLQRKVSRILGHTSVATTASFYGHVQPAMLRRSADRMDELMRKASGT